MPKTARVSFQKVLSFALLFGLVFAALGPAPARATLGQPESSIDSDRQALSASEHPRTQSTAYAIREFGTKTLTVREYIAQSTGVVFAVAWHSRQHPSMAPLLGKYFDEYLKAARPLQQTPRGRLRPRIARVTFTSENLIIQRTGHFGALEGRIYIPGQLPKEVKVDEIH